LIQSAELSKESKIEHKGTYFEMTYYTTVIIFLIATNFLSTCSIQAEFTAHTTCRNTSHASSRAAAVYGLALPLIFFVVEENSFQKVV